jgi:hypothetical protein
MSCRRATVLSFVCARSIEVSLVVGKSNRGVKEDKVIKDARLDVAVDYDARAVQILVTKRMSVIAAKLS